jgi:hypothetical protein
MGTTTKPYSFQLRTSHHQHIAVASAEPRLSLVTLEAKMGNGRLPAANKHTGTHASLCQPTAQACAEAHNPEQRVAHLAQHTPMYANRQRVCVLGLCPAHSGPTAPKTTCGHRTYIRFVCGINNMMSEERASMYTSSQFIPIRLTLL